MNYFLFKRRVINIKIQHLPIWQSEFVSVHVLLRIPSLLLIQGLPLRTDLLCKYREEVSRKWYKSKIERLQWRYVDHQLADCMQQGIQGKRLWLQASTSPCPFRSSANIFGNPVSKASLLQMWSACTTPESSSTCEYLWDVQHLCFQGAFPLHSCYIMKILLLIKILLEFH